MTGTSSIEKTALERGIQESMAEALSEKLIGPFRNGKNFLRALKTRT